MKKCIAFLLPFFFAAFLKSQTTKIGLLYARNYSSQTYFNPQKSEDGSTQTAYLPTFGITAFFEKKLTEPFWLRTEIGFRGKGHREFFQTAVPGLSGISEMKQESRFHYVSGEISPIYYFNPNSDYAPYVLGGLNFNYLAGKIYGSEATLIDNLPATLFEEAESRTFGFHLGGGMKVANAIFIEGRLTRDITPVLDLENIKVKHWVWSLNVGVDLNYLFKSAKS